MQCFAEVCQKKKTYNKISVDICNIIMKKNQFAMKMILSICITLESEFAMCTKMLERALLSGMSQILSSLKYYTIMNWFLLLFFSKCKKIILIGFSFRSQPFWSAGIFSWIVIGMLAFFHRCLQQEKIKID